MCRLGEDGSGGAVIREVSGKGTWSGGALLRRTDGIVTGNITEIDKVIRDAWDPVFRTYATSPEPDWTTFERRFGKYVRRQQMELGDITAERLKEVFGRMRGTQA